MQSSLSLGPYFVYFEKVLLLLRTIDGHALSKCFPVSRSNAKNLFSSLITIPSLLRYNLQYPVSISLRFITELLQVLPTVKHLG